MTVVARVAVEAIASILYHFYQFLANVFAVSSVSEVEHGGQSCLCGSIIPERSSMR